MYSSHWQLKNVLRVLSVLLGTALLAYLVERAGPARLLANAKVIGWGMVVVIALAGVSHLVKTWAWRLTMNGEQGKVSFWRTLGLRLISEAVAQLGFVGQMFGDGMRVSLLGSGVPVANSLSSVTLDRGLFIASGAMVSIAGISCAVAMLSLPGALRLYASVFALVLLGLVAAMAVAIHKGWPFFSGTARAAGRVPWFREWLKSKESVIETAEDQLLNFHRRAPRAFWASLSLNVLCHALAIAEVYLILHYLGVRITVLDALILEGLTKLLTAVGTVNPGNVGTYEGGNMAFAKLLGFTSTQGLTLGLCRRVRAIFWAIVGCICLIWLSKSSQRATKELAEEDQHRNAEEPRGRVDVVLATGVSAGVNFNPYLARVGTLPVLLRAILAAQSSHPDRILVVVDSADGPRIRQELGKTGRLPKSVQWVEVADITALPSVVRHAAADAERVSLILGNRTYHPSVQRMLAEWDGESTALELTSADQPIGLFSLSHELAITLGDGCKSNFITAEDLHNRIARESMVAGLGPVGVTPVQEQMWQLIATPNACAVAERKLDRWLVKPTDGIFARMNRHVSIPISRQLIKYPITPNMVSLFTLGVSMAAGVYFGLGGYWNTLIGAVLSVWASILDGSDGEVARLKLQASDFGCWLETMCDYLYYLFIFAGMAIGLARSTGKPAFLAWGAALLFGAVVTFLVASLGRQRHSGKHPEQYLAVWQKEAERRASNPLLYLGRHLEFIIRRCFLPYALLAFALLNLTVVPVCVGAVGANLAWIISLYSYHAFSRKLGAVTVGTRPTPATKPLIA